MAGHIKIDPAIERFNRMREDVYMHFRWTPRTTRIAFIGVVLVPASVYVLASAFDMKWSFSGKRKGQALTER